MKTITKIVAVATALVLSAAASQAAVVDLQISSTAPSGTIQFNPGGTFQFNGGFQIVSETGGTGSADGLTGSFSSGLLTVVNVINPYGSFVPIQQGSVTGKSGFTISAGTAGTLTGTITWGTLTAYPQSGTLLTATVSHLAYVQGATVNSDLKSIAQSAGSSLSLTFQIASGVSLSQLLASGNVGNPSSYSASMVVPVPESGTTVAGVGALALVLLAIGFRSKRSAVIRIG